MHHKIFVDSWQTKVLAIKKLTKIKIRISSINNEL